MSPFRRVSVLVIIAAFSWISAGCFKTTENTSEQTGDSSSVRNDPTGSLIVTPVNLVDGVYPAVMDDADGSPGGEGDQVVTLENVPVEGSDEPAPRTIQVTNRPLLFFRDVPNFDFKFEQGECTQIGFKNTEELKAYTRDHIGSRLAVVVDNRVISVHKIREALEVDDVRITCCTIGGGDHLHRYLKDLKLASNSSESPISDD